MQISIRKPDPLEYMRRIEEIKSDDSSRVEKVKEVIDEYSRRGGDLRELAYYVSLQSEDLKASLQPERKGYCDQLNRISNLDIAHLHLSKLVNKNLKILG